MLQIAQEEAMKLYETDPQLQHEEHALLQESVRRFWEKAGDVS
jgi:hypothetical protein